MIVLIPYLFSSELQHSVKNGTAAGQQNYHPASANHHHPLGGKKRSANRKAKGEYKMSPSEWGGCVVCMFGAKC